MSLWFLRWCFNLATISPRSTEGQLYKALVCWAEHWISQGRYQSLQEAISEFIPKIEFEHMGREQHQKYLSCILLCVQELENFSIS